jgi:hypothetical protein
LVGWLFGGVGKELKRLPSSRLRELEPLQRGRDAVPSGAIERARDDRISRGESVEVGREGGREFGGEQLQVAERCGDGAGKAEACEAPADEVERDHREGDRFEGFAAQLAAVGELAEWGAVWQQGEFGEELSLRRLEVAELSGELVGEVATVEVGGEPSEVAGGLFDAFDGCALGQLAPRCRF